MLTILQLVSNKTRLVGFVITMLRTGSLTIQNWYLVHSLQLRDMFLQFSFVRFSSEDLHVG